MGMLPCFSPMKCLDFGTDFWLEKEEIWTMSFMEIVATIMNLMLGF